MKHFKIVLAAALLSGCEAKVDDLQVFIDEVKQTTNVNVEPYPEFESKTTFIYSADVLRSPFQRPRNSDFGVAVKVSSQPNCEQPDFSRGKQPLEEFGIDALSFIGIFQSNGKKWAIIQSNTGGLFKVTIGDYLGLFSGKINFIQDGIVSYTEMLPDGAGCWKKKQSSLTMLLKAGENNV